MGPGVFLTREVLTITGLTIIANGKYGKSARFETIVPKGACLLSGKRVKICSVENI